MAINVFQTHTTIGIKDPIMVSRHNLPDFSLAVTINGGATYTIQATISQLNQGEAGIWFDIPSGTALTTDLFDKIVDAPLEAIRINITVITDFVTFQVAQNTA